MNREEKNSFIKLIDDLEKWIGDLEKWIGGIEEIIEGKQKEPLIVSVMGQTGVGKSTLVNQLFGTNLPTHPIHPGTGKIESIDIKGNNGHIVSFNDLPGVGESNESDKIWVPKYREYLQKSHVVIWAISAENRAFRYDQDTLNELIKGLANQEQIELVSKIIFVLTKVDFLTDFNNPTKWILEKMSNDQDAGMFIPEPNLLDLIKEKEQYFQNAFIKPFEHLIQTKVHYKTRLKKHLPANMHYNGRYAYYKGVLKEEDYNDLCRKHPNQKSVFKQIFSSTQVVSCSALHRYHLELLMYVITSKLETSSVGSFKEFVSDVSLDRVVYSKSERYNNIIRVPSE